MTLTSSNDQERLGNIESQMSVQSVQYPDTIESQRKHKVQSLMTITSSANAVGSSWGTALCRVGRDLGWALCRVKLALGAVCLTFPISTKGLSNR